VGVGVRVTAGVREGVEVLEVMTVGTWAEEEDQLKAASTATPLAIAVTRINRGIKPLIVATYFEKSSTPILQPYPFKAEANLRMF
jgi:hypothetical protein